MQNNTIAAAMPGFGTKTILAAAVAAVISTGAFAATSAEALVVDGTGQSIADQNFFDLTSDEAGTAVNALNGATVTLTNVTFTNNTSNLPKSGSTNQNAGGALAASGSGTTVTAENVTYANNKATAGNGGALAISDAAYAQTGGSLSGNSAMGGGALSISGGSASFTDVAFTDNTATGFGGAIMADKAAEVTIAAKDVDLVISGNAGGDETTYTGKKYAGHTGGFIHAKGNSNLTLDAAEGRTITIGTVGESTDSLTSYTTRAEGGHGTLTKTGEGKVVINSSMEAWKNDVVVKAGTLEIMSGIGSYDLSVVATNGFLNNYGQTVKATGSSTLILHDVLFNSREKAVGKTCEGLSIYAADTSTVKAGTFTVGDSSYGLSGGEQQGLGSIDVAAGASASIEKLVINSGGFQVWGSGRVTIGDVVMNGGQLELKDNSITRIDGSVTFDKDKGAALAFNSSATLETAWTNLINDDLETTTVFGEALRTGKNEGKGKGKIKIVETAYKGTYTLDQLKDANRFFGGVDTGVFSFENATLVGNDKGNVSISEVIKEGGTYGQSTLKAAPSEEGGTVAITAVPKDISFGALEVDAATTEVKITNDDATVTMVGAKDSGNLLEGRNVERLDFSGTLNLGDSTDDAGTVNAEALSATTLNVNGNYSAKTVHTVTGTVSEGASLSMGTLVIGTGSQIEQMSGASNTMTVDGTLELAGATKGHDVSGGTVAVNGLLTTNAAASAAYADTGAVLYVDRKLSLNATTVTVGADNELGKSVPIKPTTTTTPSASTVAVKSTGTLVLDTTGFVQTLADVETYADSDVGNTVFGKNTKVTVDGKLVLTNVLKTGLIELGSDDSTIGSNVTTDSKFIGVDLTSGLQLVYNSVIGNYTLDARLAARYAQGLSSKEASIIKALEANEAFFGTGVTRTLTAEGLAAYAQAMGGNVTAGVLNVAYDANAQVADAIARHQLAAGNAMGVWADVFHTKNEAKKLYGKTGYEADITGGVLGFDMPVADLFKAGAAVVVGTADTDTVGGLKNSVDTDFWGVSLYAVKDFAGLNVKADLGYLDFSNDFKGTGDASDATSMTFGVRGDFTAYQSGVVTVAPHFGLRFTKIDTDAVAFNKGQDMNVLEAPIGVAVAAAFEAQGWTFRPTADVTIVPQLGDKSVESFGSASEVTVLSGGLVNTTVGVTAEQGAFVFGLNAGYGFGPSDRANTNVNASVVYRF